MSASLINNLSLLELNQAGISKKTMTLVFDCNINWIERNINLIPNVIEVAKLKYLQKLIDEQKDYTFQLGYRYFYGLKLFLLKGVFVPQFDTEGLVQLVLQNLNPKQNLNGFEVGFGSGAISLALAKNSNWTIDAIDSNDYAYILARQNQEHNFKFVPKINWIHNDLLFYESTKKYDFIVSNPPYIDENDPLVSRWVLENQPFDALFSKEKGLKHFHYILEFANKNLKPNGIIFLEMGFQQKEVLINLFQNKPYSFEFHLDINQNWRFVILKKHAL